MDNIPLVEDLFVPILELMMKKQDLMDYEVVLALYTISHSMDCIIDEIAEDDLPEMLRSDYRSVKSSIYALIESIEKYHDAKKETFLSACED